MSKLGARARQAFGEALVCLCIRFMSLGIRSGERSPCQCPLHGSLEIGKRARPNRRKERGAVRPALFAIHGRDGQAKHIRL